MLASLTIRNFVLIEDAVLEFKPGLNVLTGETGAGKTLLTRALGLLMGERAEDGLVGKVGSEALIQAVFDLDERDIEEIPPDVQELLGGVEAGEFIVSRRLGKQGRNRCFLNDTVVTLGAMGSAISGLLSFAGQHEYRRLLDPHYQLSVLDQWAGAGVTELAYDFREVYAEAREAGRRLEQARAREGSRERELQLLRFQVKELGDARLSLEEERSLAMEQRMLSRAEELLRSVGSAGAVLGGETDTPDVTTLLAQAVQQLAAVSSVDPDLDRITAGLTEVQYQTAELARDLHGYVSRISVDPERLAAVNDRLKTYTDLARKYGGSTESALAQCSAAAERLMTLEQEGMDLEELEEARAAYVARALSLAATLTDRRRKTAPLLEKAVAAQLESLGMPSAELRVSLSSATNWEGLRESGAETVEFLLVANPGQVPRNLGRTASGGELSRVLLAIKCALAGVGGNETLVFDEIDAGIGGRTAVVVGNKLRELAGHSQLIVVTHLPQVAALAAQHYVIDKITAQGDTVTRLTALTGDEVVEELCRMLGGRPGDTEALAHARDLRDRALGGLLD
ncbi:MAG: DNA repair protein RecN [Actinobacteria bacterium]|nr:DNA repair protein RecN [Actinomycetota bacterium]